MPEPEHELEKLLGGFAADTLTPEEREKLFRAALQDQQLFNALADEQALKELLTDPAVRRRVLQLLARQQGTGPSPSWRDWFARPAPLAWAGGLAAGVFAVILGLNIYQESLHQASEPAAREEVKLNAQAPRTPSTAPSAQAPLDPSAMEPKADSPATPATKDAVTGTQRTRDQAAVSKPKGTSDIGIEHGTKPAPSRSKESEKREAPVASLGKSTEEPSSPSDRRLSPSAPAPELDARILAESGGGSVTGISAKALFSSDVTARREFGSETQEKDTAPMLKSEPSALLKAKDRTAPSKPLALRYGFVIRDSGGQERDVNAEGRSGLVTLSVESNQEAYLQIWTRAGDSLPELVLPAKETGRISLKTVAGQRQEIKVPQENDRVIVRLSRVPFGPITRQEAVMAGRSAPHLVTESASEAQEQATYVANPDPSAAELAIEIPLNPRPSR